MKPKWLKLCSLILTFALFVQMLPMSAWAVDTDKEASASSQGQTLPMEEIKVLGELTERRTEYAKEFRLNNGMILAAVYSEPVHFEKAGAWEEIDNTLVRKTGGYGNTQGVWNVTLPDDLGNGSVTIEKDGYTLSFQMAGKLTQAPGLEVMSSQAQPLTEATALTPETVSLTLDGTTETLAVADAEASQASVQQVDLTQLQAAAKHPETVVRKNASALTYGDVYLGTDVRYDLQSNRVKESIIMEAWSESLRGYRYTLNVGTLRPVLQEDGSVIFFGAGKEEVVFYMPAPYLVDANDQVSYDVQVSLTGSNGVYSLVYLLPRTWLADSERAWPVVLDPAVLADLNVNNIRDVSFNENMVFSYRAGTLDCGYRLDKASASRFLVKYADLPTLTSSDVIVDATMRLSKPYNSSVLTPVEAHKVLDTWESETLTVDNIPDFDEKIEDYARVQYSGDYEWNITDIVQGWYTGENTGVLFKADAATESDTSRSSLKEFYSSDWGTPRYMPTLTITYRNNDGMESYWDYRSASAGRAGSGHVNTFTGNLAFIRSDMGFDGNRMPVFIEHVYNLNDSASNEFGLGYGWRTNYHQRVFSKTLSNITYYVWEDADGTSHYFKYKSYGVYEDETDSKMTIRTVNVSSDTGVSGAKYSVNNDNGNVSVFDSNGRLIRILNNQKVKSNNTITYTATSGYHIDTITDGVGRKYKFNYTNDLLSNISYTGTGTEPLHSVTYGYTDGNLTSVEDQDEADCTYTYTGHILTSATDIDGYWLSYEYDIPTGDYQPYRVKKVTEYDDTTQGGELNLTYGHNETTLTDGNGNRQIQQYNDFGNVVSIQDGEGRAQYAKYFRNTDSDTQGKANQLQLSSKLQYTVSNLLTDTGFESGTVWTPEGTYAQNNAVTETESYLGGKSLQITGENTSALGPVFTAQPGETYTFSAWVKTGSVPAWLRLGTKTSETLPANSDWTRLEVSYTNATAASQSLRPRVHTDNGGGATYIDCVQLENAPTASRYNLIQNGDFRNGTAGWTGDGYTLVQGSAAAPQLEATAAKVTGSTASQQHFTQTVPLSGEEGDTLVFAGWAKGDSVPLKGEDHDAGTREFSLIATFQYTDNTTKDFTAQFNPDVSVAENWQYVSEVMVAEKDYSSVTLALAYDYNCNDVLFDGIQLYKEAFGSSYAYDEDGNVTSVIDLQGQLTEYEYTNNDLTKQILPTGAELTYEYDTWHNVTKATSEEGQVYEFTYDDWGNNTAVSIVNGESKITATATYTDDGNYTATVTDALGNTTEYGYNTEKGVLLWSKAPEDTDATRINYTHDELFRTATAAATTDTGLHLSAQYSYENDLLTKIKTPSTTYSFGYGDFALRSSESIGTRTLASYTYTERNHYLQELEYGNEDSVQYTYDNMGRLLTQTYEDGDTVSYTYDNSGALAKVTDSATGRTTTYYYDFTDRLMKTVEEGVDYYHSVGYTYDRINNLTQLVENVNGTEHTTSYTYDDDNRITSKTTDGITVSYTYDAFGRVTEQTTKRGEAVILTESFTYNPGTENGQSAQVATYTTTSRGVYSVTYSYTYDNNGNILTISDGSNTTSYEYDSANQLIRENNQSKGYTYLWSYDNAGNRTGQIRYAYTTGTISGDPTSTKSYTYGLDGWGDLLTGWSDGTSPRDYTYDGIGNPLSDGKYTYTWEHGKQLAQIQKGTVTGTYTYDADGLRIARTYGGVSYTYVYSGSQLVRMKRNNDTLYFTYDSAGTPVTVNYNGTVYFYVTNLQGDVVAIVDHVGNAVLNYTYDAWGKMLACTGNMSTTLGFSNPLRYRGYVYDLETGLYYLKSRYYDPEIGRFISPDMLISTGQKFNGHNMFAYCLNNPVNCIDSDGYDAIWLQEEGNAKTMGHTGLLVEDDDGKWYLFYWGPKSDKNAIKNPFETELDVRLIELSNVDYDVKKGKFILTAADESNQKFVNTRCEKTTGAVYLKGDYTNTYEYLDTMTKNAENENLKYSLLQSNCVQVTTSALRLSNPFITGPLQLSLIPNCTYIKVRFYNMINNFLSIFF